MVRSENSKCVISEDIANVDFKNLYNWLKDFESVRYMTPLDEFYFIRNVKELKAFFRRFLAESAKNRYFYICTKNGKFVGYIVIGVFGLGLFIGKPHWYKGYGFNGMLMFLNYYLNKLGKRKHIISTCIKNENAIKLYKKLGYKTIKSVPRDHPYFVKKNKKIIKKSTARLFLKISQADFNLKNKDFLKEIKIK